MANDQSVREWYVPLVPHTGSEKPSLFAKVLAENLPIEPGITEILDVGCGSGVIGISALIKQQARSVTFNDRLPQWIETARRNVEIGVRAGTLQPIQVSFLTPCRFQNIPQTVIERQTLLVFNPPQLPTAYVDNSVLERMESTAAHNVFRNGGRTGFDVVQEFLEWYADLPVSKPEAVIILSSFLGQSRIAHAIRSHGLREVGRKEIRIPLRRLFSNETIRRLSAPERQDRALEPDGNGWWTKKLITLRLASG
jgi:methylase of polypeptide subunit release factors